MQPRPPAPEFGFRVLVEDAAGWWRLPDDPALAELFAHWPVKTDHADLFDARNMAKAIHEEFGLRTQVVTTKGATPFDSERDLHRPQANQVERDAPLHRD